MTMTESVVNYTVKKKKEKKRVNNSVHSESSKVFAYISQRAGLHQYDIMF